MGSRIWRQLGGKIQAALRNGNDFKKRHDEGSPIYGMPIINVDKAKTVFVLKRSMNPGFAGVQNELFFYDNTRMLFGDAKQSIQGLITEFKD